MHPHHPALSSQTPGVNSPRTPDDTSTPGPTNRRPILSPSVRLMPRDTTARELRPPSPPRALPLPAELLSDEVSSRHQRWPTRPCQPPANRRATPTPFRTESFKTSRDGALAGLTQSFLPSSGHLRTWGPLRASRIRGGIPGTPACCPENFSLRLCPDCLLLETGRGRHFPREASGPVRGLLTATSSAGSGACAPGLPGPVRAGAGVFSSRLYNGDSGVACAISE